jgi:hypothetical protein
VADQLQTNFASDLRAILKAVFLINASPVGMNRTSSMVYSFNNKLMHFSCVGRRKRRSQWKKLKKEKKR